MPDEIAIRKKFELDGENFYITVGKTFTHATVPYENRPDKMKLRETVDLLCEKISEALEELHGIKE